MTKILVALCASFAFEMASAQDVFTLKECLEQGLGKNFDIRIERNEHEISRNNNTAGNAGMLPTIDLTGGYSGELTKIIDEEETQQSKHSTLKGNLSADWIVFDGFKMQATKGKLSEMQNKSELALRMAIDNLMSEILVAYNNLIYQTQKLNYVKATVDISKERVRIVEARYQVGTMSHLDLKQAMVALNSDMSKFITQKEVVDNCVVELNKLMAREPIDQPIGLADSTLNLSSIGSLAELQEATYASNVELLSAASSRELTEYELKIVQSDYYPYLKLGAGFGVNKTYKYDEPTNQTLQYGPQIGATIGLNLFNGFNTKRAERNKKIELQNAKLREDDVRLNLNALLSSLYLSYQSNNELRKMEHENLIIAREYYETAIDKYKLGSLSGIELREAQVSLLEAEERLILAQFNVKLCEISLKKISGNIGDYLK